MKWIPRVTAAAIMATAFASNAQEAKIQETTQEQAGIQQQEQRAPDAQEQRTVRDLKDTEFRGPHYRWELAIPDHLPKEARYPQHLLSGRKVRILPVNDAEDITGTATLSLEGSSQTYDLEPKKKSNGAFTVELPLELPPGNHTLNFGNNRVVLPLPVTRTPVTVDPIGIPIMRMRRDITRLECNDCYWEAAIYQDPNDPQRGALIGNTKTLVTTTDGWRTVLRRNIDDIVTKPFKGYFCDPKFTTLIDGRMSIVGLTYTPGEAITGALWTADTNISRFEQTMLGPIADAAYLSIAMDYPKIVVDDEKESPWKGSTYISANALYFPEQNWRGTGLITIRNGIMRKARGKDIGMNQPPHSGVVLNGSVHFSRDDGNQLSLYTSEDGGASFETRVIAQVPHYSFARVSNTSNRGWLLYRGPQLAVDSERNILYAAWATHEQSIPDPDFEYREYGANFDVFVSRSFDNGRTWSSPAKVNDDTTKGDQGFPSIGVDKEGVVFVSFTDHRYRQDEAVYDVYIAKSNNFGATFGSNYKVNDYPVPNLNGGRVPGDYLDMLGITKKMVNVFHPCVGKTTNVWNPTDACVTRIAKDSIPGTKR